MPLATAHASDDIGQCFLGRFTAVFARKAPQSLNEPEPGRSTGRTETSQPCSQILRGALDHFLPRWIGVSAHVDLKEYPAAGRLRAGPLEAHFQLRPLADSLAHARIVLAFGSHDHVMAGESPLLRKVPSSVPVFGKQVRKVAFAAGPAEYFQVEFVVDPDKQFEIPREQTDHRVRAERTFAGHAEWQT